MVQQTRYRLILLPVDGSDAAQAAAEHAALLAAALGAAVAILGVIDTSAGFSFGAAGAAAYTTQRAEIQAAIQAASAILRDTGVARVEHLIMDGVPREAIIEVADEQGADLIVLGVAHAMLDDAAHDRVAVYVLRHARLPVLIVPGERMARQ